jgi:NAD+ kinase
MKRKSVVIAGDGRKDNVQAAVARLRPAIERLARVAAVDLAGRTDLEKIKADLVIVFGGDGSILAAARRLGRNAAPVLSAMTLDEFEAGLKAVLTGPVKAEWRMMLRCDVLRRGKPMGSFSALNDAVVTHSTISRMLHIALKIDGQQMATVRGDGLIIATPVGSTAHSLSAGGPILHPGLEAFVICPICPHTLGIRPIVVPAAHSVVLEMASHSEEVVLTIDGQVYMYLHDKDVLKISRESKKFRLVAPEGRGFYGTLREKLGWGGQFYGDCKDR